MPGLSGNSRAAANASMQVYASQGESTPAARLPKKFQARNEQTDAMPGLVQLDPPPPDSLALAPGQPSAVVRRWPRMVGMRYLYAFGHMRMDVHRDGAGGIPNPWISAFQKMLHGPIKNAGFNDALYQAGYPGFNLGLSFGVQTTPASNARPGAIPPIRNVGGWPGSRVQSMQPIRYARPTGKALGQ